MTPLTRSFTALRAAVYFTGFTLLWAWLALSARACDPALGIELPAWLSPIGSIVMLAGGAVALSCAVLFVARGDGTPAPFDPPQRFVAKGPYRYVRNPMYVGALTALAGSGMYFRSAAMLLFTLCATGLAHGLVVLVEEAVLDRRFGEDYQQYKRTVGRWLPRLHRGDMGR